MTVLAVLDEDGFSALDESAQGFYKLNEADGLYKLNMSSDEATKLVPDLRGEIESIRGHMDRVMNEKKKETAKRQELEQILKSHEKPPKKADDDPAFQAQLESFRLAKEEAEGRLAEYQGKVAASMKKAEIARLRAEHNLNETAEYVLDRFLEVAAVDGSEDLVLRVVENGKPAFVGGDAVTPDGLLEGFIRQGLHRGIFNAPSGGGTGGRNDYGPGKSGQKTVRRAAFEEFGPIEKSDFMREVREGKAKLID